MSTVYAEIKGADGLWVRQDQGTGFLGRTLDSDPRACNLQGVKDKRTSMYSTTVISVREQSGKVLLVRHVAVPSSGGVPRISAVQKILVP